MKQAIAVLEREIKRHYIYRYGKAENALSGTLTISKRFLSEPNADYLAALLEGEVRIENCAEAEVFLRGFAEPVDLCALELVAAVQQQYEIDGAAPLRLQLK